MEFNHIRYFVETCKYKSISDAACGLYMSQQALSRCISNLEKELDYTLFARTSKGIELTHEGLYLYELFRPLISRYYECVEIATVHLKRQPVRLPFCCGPGVIRNISPELLIMFGDQNPGIELEMIESTDVQIEEYIRADRARFGLMVLPQCKQGREYEHTIVKTEPTYLLVHKDHPFAQLPCVSLAMLKNEQVLALGKTSFFLESLNHALEPFNFSVTPFYESSDVTQLCSLVKKGLGVLLCIRQIYEDSDKKDFVLIPVKERTFDYNIAFVYQSIDALDATAKSFMQFILENAAT